MECTAHKWKQPDASSAVHIRSQQKQTIVEAHPLHKVQEAEEWGVLQCHSADESSTVHGILRGQKAARKDAMGQKVIGSLLVDSVCQQMLLPSSEKFDSFRFALLHSVPFSFQQSNLILQPARED